MSGSHARGRWSRALWSTRNGAVYLWSLSLLGILAGCAEERNPSEVEIETHPAEWIEPTSASFHGLRVMAREGFVSCRSCHGDDLKGGNGIPSCWDCHGGPSGHPFDWLSPGDPEFHGFTVEDSGPTVCQSCHGFNYRGGWAGRSCYECHDGPGGHPVGWIDPTSSNFHSIAVGRLGIDECRRCHGSNLDGGTSGLACSVCHG